jgi:hypothetical protein
VAVSDGPTETGTNTLFVTESRQTDPRTRNARSLSREQDCVKLLMVLVMHFRLLRILAISSRSDRKHRGLFAYPDRQSAKLFAFALDVALDRASQFANLFRCQRTGRSQSFSGKVFDSWGCYRRCGWCFLFHSAKRGFGAFKAMTMASNLGRRHFLEPSRLHERVPIRVLRASAHYKSPDTFRS